MSLFASILAPVLIIGSAAQVTGKSCDQLRQRDVSSGAVSAATRLPSSSAWVISEAQSGQQEDNAAQEPGGDISGTVTDGSGAVIPGAEVLLESDAGLRLRTLITDQSGFFEFRAVEADHSYRITVTATGFATWASSVLHVEAGHFLLLGQIALRVDGGPVSITVTASRSPVELATEQVHIAEQQRVFGFIPNFLVVYDQDPVPLTAKLKFKLALRVAIDPVTFIGVAGFAAINQAASTPNYIEGLKGYGQRAGALYADGFMDLMLAGAVLPSVLHQDPRYFYQGTGTAKSRALHAVLSPFLCRGDNGRRQPNYSSLGGDIASTAISEAYYPASNRGVGFLFGNFSINTAERMASALAQEFLLRKLTPGAAKNSNH